MNSVATQGILVASGLQDKFSWNSVAASAIGAVIGNQIGQSIGSSSLAEKNPDFARLATSVTRGVTGAIVRHGITGDDIDYSQVAADSFGNAIADEIVGQLRQPQMAETSQKNALREGEASQPGLRLGNVEDFGPHYSFEQDVDSAYIPANDAVLGDDDAAPQLPLTIGTPEPNVTEFDPDNAYDQNRNKRIYDFGDPTMVSVSAGEQLAADTNSGRNVKAFRLDILGPSLIDQINLDAKNIEKPGQHYIKSRDLAGEARKAEESQYTANSIAGAFLLFGGLATSGVRLAGGSERDVEYGLNAAAAGEGLVAAGSGLGLRLASLLPRANTGGENIIRGVDASTLNRSHEISGRTSSRNVNEIADGMRESGYRGPPIDVVESNGKYYIIDGHHRAAAARRTGTPVDIRVVDDITNHPSGFRSIEEVVTDAQLEGRDRITHPEKYKK